MKRSFVQGLADNQCTCHQAKALVVEHNQWVAEEEENDKGKTTATCCRLGASLSDRRKRLGSNHFNSMLSDHFCSNSERSVN